MAIEILMPKLSDTMEDGKILQWMKEEGDTVNSGDILAEIETDKADMEFEVIDDGVLLKILMPEGSSAPVGELIAIIGEEGEDISEYLKGDSAEKKEPKEEEPKYSEEDKAAEVETGAKDSVDEQETEESKEVDSDTEEDIEKAKDMAVVDEVPGDIKDATKTTPSAFGVSHGAVKASPVARRLADEAGISIKDISGSGPDGRVVKRDVEALINDGEKPAKPEPETKQESKPVRDSKPVTFESPKKLESKREAMSGMRKTIAKRLVQSKVEVPHFYLTIEVDTANLTAARESVKQQDGYTISVNDFIVKACATALLHHPMVNASIEGDDIVFHDSVDIGVAVALDEGLITPYVRDAHKKGLGAIAREVKELAGRARSRKLKPEEYSGGSMTISNLGMFGIDEFTAIINPPESTILAVGQSREVPVVVDGEMTIGHRMKITLSCDHRLVDGAVGARFLQTLRSILENPMQMLV